MIVAASRNARRAPCAGVVNIVHLSRPLLLLSMLAKHLVARQFILNAYGLNEAGVLAREPNWIMANNNTNQTSFDPKAFLAIVGEGKTILEYRKDQVVFTQGDVADTVFYIQKGRVKLVVISEQGKEAVVGILGPGQFFGEGCMNGHSVRIATTTAMEECVVTAITKTAMLATLHDQPKFSELFMAYLLTRNSRIEEDLIDQLFNSSEKRLARLLLLLANFGKEGSPQPISPNISQETLAEMISTTRSRVSFFMNKFRKLGFISYNGNIEVHNSLLNAVLYDKPEIKREA
jgi:CRP-like cAMP-binding protein